VALSVDINANTRQAQSQVKDLSKELDKYADSLDDMARDADRAGEKVERTFRDMAREANKLDDSVKDIGNGTTKSFGKIGDAAQEVAQEVGQNLGEAVSSIRGDLSDLGQVGQDTLGGLAATLAGSGPAGIAGAAALAAGAVGLGLVTAELQKQQEEADRMRERIGAAYQGAAEDGKRFIDTQTMIADGLDLMFNPERAEEYKRVIEDANKLGLDRSTVIAANTGDLSAQEEVQAQINRLLEDSNSYELTGTTNKKTLKNDVADIRDRWKEVVKTTQDYADKALVANDYTSDMLLGLIESAGTAQEEVDELNNRLITLPTGEQIVIDAETGQATSDLTKFKGDADGVIASVNGKQVVITAKAAIEQARRDFDGFVKSVDGKTITVRGRVKVDSGWD
jgi:hypothetical protein